MLAFSIGLALVSIGLSIYNLTMRRIERTPSISLIDDVQEHQYTLVIELENGATFSAPVSADDIYLYGANQSEVRVMAQFCGFPTTVRCARLLEPCGYTVSNLDIGRIACTIRSHDTIAFAPGALTFDVTGREGWQ